MILRRLLSLTPNNQNFYKSHPFHFSSTQQHQPSHQQTQQQQPQQTHTQPNTLQQTHQQQQTLSPQTFQSKQSQRREEKFDNFLVYDYLVRSRPEMNVKNYSQKIEGLSDLTQIMNMFDECQNDIEQQKRLPIKDFQKKLNLSYQTLMKKSFHQSEIHNQHLSKIANETLNHFSLPKIKKLYVDRTYKSIQTPGFVSNILKAISTKGKESFLLNIVYEVISGSTKINQKIQDLSELQSYFENVSFGTYNDVNPIKFFWAASRIKPQLQKKTSQLLLRQFNNRLSINNKNVSKQFKSLSYFFLSKEISSKVILKLLNSSSDLEQVVNTWVIIMLVMSRTQKILESGKIPMNVNFQDIYSLNQKVNHNREFIKNTFPKILSDFEKLNILEVYQKSLQKPQGNQLDIVRGDLENDFDFDVSSQKKIELSYQFNEDPLEFRTYLNNPIFSQVPVDFVQKRLIERIVKRQYSAALEQYEAKIGQKLKNHDVVNQYKFEAKNLGFSSSDSQALYVLRHIFRDSKDFIDTPKHVLSEQKFNKTFFNTGLNRDQRKPATFRPKTNYLDEDAIDNEREYANAQILQNKSNQTPAERPRGLFQKRPIASFSTGKQIEGQSQNMNNSQYENYLKAVKDVEESEKMGRQQVGIKYDFSNCATLEQVEAQFKTHLGQINQNNMKELNQKYQNIPVVKNIKTLIKHFFLNVQINNQTPNGLLVSFESSFGQVEKDYAKYLEGHPFLFQMPDFLYEELLNNQNKRQKFKKVVAHILLYSSNISDVLVRKICQICEKQKIGLTLLEVINLINAKKITISYESLKKIASSVQHFKGMESDLLQFLKNYAERAGLQLETKLFEPYIGNLTLSEKYQGLNSFLEILRQEIKSKQYKINPNKTPAENIEAQKIYKIKEAERTNSQLFEILRIISISLKPRTTVPSFVTEMMDLYFSKKTSPLNSKDYGVGLIIYSQNQEKFLDLLSKVKEEKNENNQFVLESVIRSLLLFGRNLKNQIQKILGATLFKKQFNLNEVQLNNFGFIFKELDIPGAYGEYLEYLLKKQPMITPEIKNLYYKILNNTTDDYSKNQISGLLDFLFNPSRQKERVQYKQVKIQEERKSQLLNNMKNQDYSNKSQAKVTQVQALNSSAQAKGTGKEKKKSKSKKGVEQEIGVVKVEQKKEEKIEMSKKQKAQKDLDAFFMAKINSSFSYDNNRKYIYNEKLSAYDKRKSSLRQFLGHMAPRLKQEEAGKEKSGKGKETKETGKKETSGKRK